MVDEIINSIIDLGAQIHEESAVKKLQRTLPPRFDSKVLVIEEKTDLDKLRKDELHAILTAYEMRTKMEKSSRKEESFKPLRNKNATIMSRIRTHLMYQSKRKQTL